VGGIGLTKLLLFSISYRLEKDRRMKLPSIITIPHLHLIPELQCSEGRTTTQAAIWSTFTAVQEKNDGVIYVKTFSIPFLSGRE